MRASKVFKEIDTKDNVRCVDWFYSNKNLYDDVWNTSEFIHISYKGFMLRLGGKI